VSEMVIFDYEYPSNDVKVTIEKYSIFNSIIPKKYINDNIVDLPLYLKEVHNK
jgi:hypothetical protein